MYSIEDNVTGQNFSNLHDLWDSGIGLLNLIKERPINETSLKYIRSFSAEIMNNFTRENLQKELKENDI